MIGTFHRQEHGLHTELLFKESLVAMLPKAHPLSRKAKLTWLDLKGMPILTLPRGSVFREKKGAPINHTFFFSLSDGRVIDGGRRGNDARLINHSCEPNCEALEHADGRVYIYALRDIERGEELSYHYALIYDGGGQARLPVPLRCPEL